eukprot:m51a1_g1552 putative checkpoint protein hus1 (277) ;mRNA; f:4260-5383
MRFRAKLCNVSLFIRVLNSVSKIDKTCIIHLTNDKDKGVRFILATDATDGVELFGGMSPSTLFEDMRIESLHQNEIGLQVHVDSLERALRSGANAVECTARLSKNTSGHAILAIQSDVAVPQRMTVNHEVPVVVVSPSELAARVEPPLETPDVHIALPELRGLRTVVEHLRNLSDCLTIEANMAGELAVSVDTPAARVTTSYHDLEHPAIASQVPKSDKDRRASVRVDVAKVMRFLHCSQVGPQSVVCCIFQRKVVVLHAVLDDLYLTYYLPILTS